jgi:hypothetical protein
MRDCLERFFDALELLDLRFGTWITRVIARWKSTRQQRARFETERTGANDG